MVSSPENKQPIPIYPSLEGKRILLIESRFVLDKIEPATSVQNLDLKWFEAHLPSTLFSDEPQTLLTYMEKRKIDVLVISPWPEANCIEQIKEVFQKEKRIVLIEEGDDGGAKVIQKMMKEFKEMGIPTVSKHDFHTTFSSDLIKTIASLFP